MRVERHPELIAALVAAGHTVYAHGWDHQLYGAARANDAMQAMARTEKLLVEHRPTPATYLLRLPYNAGLRSAAIHRAMRGFHPNVQFAWWSHAIADYQIAGKLRSEADIRQVCAETTARLMECRDLEGGILLLHDAAITEPQESAILATRLLLPSVSVPADLKRLNAQLLGALKDATGASASLTTAAHACQFAIGSVERCQGPFSAASSRLSASYKRYVEGRARIRAQVLDTDTHLAEFRRP